jgi:hypothetical protein
MARPCPVIGVAGKSPAMTKVAKARAIINLVLTFGAGTAVV